MEALKRQFIMLLIMTAFAGGALIGVKFSNSPAFLAVRQLYGDLVALEMAKPTARVAITPAELERMIADGEITVEIDGESYIVFIGEEELDDSVRQAAANAPAETRHQAVQDVLMAAMPRKPPKSLQPEPASTPASAPAGRPGLGSLETILGALGLDLPGGSSEDTVNDTLREAMEQAQSHVDGGQ